MFDRIHVPLHSPYSAYIGNFFGRQLMRQLSEAQQHQFQEWYHGPLLDPLFSQASQLRFGDETCIRLEAPMFLDYSAKYPALIGVQHV
jgi:hypothetical protein